MGKDPERGKYTSPEGSRRWEYISAGCCAIGLFSVGNLLGWNSPSLNELRAPNSQILVTPEEASTLTASVSIGHLLGFPLNLFIVDKIGRRKSMLLACIPLLINWGLIAVAPNVEVLTLARTVGGISMGIIISTSPLFMVEILSANIRGSLIAICGIFCYTGIFFMFGAIPYLGVKLTACCCMGFTMIFLTSFWFVPESPYFLMRVGRVEEAENALEKLRGKTDVSEEIQLIKETLREKGKSLVKKDENGQEDAAREPSSLKQLFTIRGNVKAFMIGCLITTLQHFCGFQTILYYCHVILADMGTDFDVYTASLIFSILQVVASGITVFVMDRIGRRPLIITAGLITTFLLFIIATYFYLMEHMNMDIKEYSMIPLYSVFALALVLNLGVMSVCGILPAEIYAPDVKVLASCIVMVFGSCQTIFISKIYFLMAKAWGLGHSAPFTLFAIITFACIAILARWLPETRGKTLLAIQKELNA